MSFLFSVHSCAERATSTHTNGRLIDAHECGNRRVALLCMTKNQKRKQDEQLARQLSQASEKIGQLSEVLEEFTGKARVDEIGFDVRSKAWQFTFTNGHTVSLFSDGTCERTAGKN